MIAMVLAVLYRHLLRGQPEAILRRKRGDRTNRLHPHVFCEQSRSCQRGQELLPAAAYGHRKGRVAAAVF